MIAVLLFVVMALLDMTSSILAMRLPGVYESNPYTRDISHNFVVIRHIVYNLLWLIGLGIISVALYQATKDWDERSMIGKTLAGLPFFFNSLSAVPAVVNNIMIALRWYVP